MLVRLMAHRRYTRRSQMRWSLLRSSSVLIYREGCSTEAAADDKERVREQIRRMLDREVKGRGSSGNGSGDCFLHVAPDAVLMTPGSTSSHIQPGSVSQPSTCVLPITLRSPPPPSDPRLARRSLRQARAPREGLGETTFWGARRDSPGEEVWTGRMACPQGQCDGDCQTSA